jgi:glyoxylase-like metal-dependent hydrolase (beta-lactamase superfamily II)
MKIAKWQAIEGNMQHLDGGAMFGHVPKAMWEHWIKSDSQNRIPLACRALLVQTEDGRNILFETGIGAFFEPKLKERYGVTPNEHILLKNLEKVGVTENEIDAVVLSHLHFDHAGGILSAYGDGPPRILFPKAKIYLGKRNWEFSQNPHPREVGSYIPHLNQLLKESGRVVLIDGETHPDLNFGVSFVYSDGHTIGMMISVIHLDSGPMAFVTDLVPGAAWVHLSVYMGYDRFPEQKYDEKVKLFGWILERNGSLFFTHDPLVTHGKLKRDEQGRYSVI